MDLLDFGMENAESRSLFIRMLAAAARKLEMMKADLYEMYLNQRPTGLLDNPLRDRQMLQRIMEQAEECSGKNC